MESEKAGKVWLETLARGHWPWGVSDSGGRRGQTFGGRVLSATSRKIET